MSDTKILLIAYIQGLSDSDCEKLWNFLNSEATFETPSVNDNEAQKKDCDNCYFKDEPNYMNPCLCCINHDNWCAI